MADSLSEKINQLSYCAFVIIFIAYFKKQKQFSKIFLGIRIRKPFVKYHIND